tara:strand:+ start:8511 stop:9719 length:1209 start_codon:yes stop_codon:yes gene_type:complete
MSTRKRDGYWFIDVSHEGRRIRLKSPDNSRAGARAYELLVRQRLSRGESAQGYVCPTLDDFYPIWYRDYVVPRNKQSEQRTKRGTFNRHLLQAFGKRRLDDISVREFDRYQRRKQQEGLSNKTINNHLAILGRCLRVAKDWDVLNSVPKLKPLPVRRVEAPYLRQEEGEKLLETMEDPFWRTMVLFALRTGVRFGELLGLRWADLDLKARTVVVRRSIVKNVQSTPKSNEPRMIPLGRELCHALNAWPERREGYVFGRDGGRRPLNSETARLTLNRAYEAAGLDFRGWHALRHSFASQLVSGGASIRVAQKLLGHSDVKTTERYVHVASEELFSSVERLSQREDEWHEGGTKSQTVRIPRTRRAARKSALALNGAKKQTLRSAFGQSSEGGTRTVPTAVRNH